MTSHDKDHISLLIKKRSVAKSTESLIGFIADTNGMLRACRGLLETISSRDSSIEQWFYKECEIHGINQKLMLSDIENVAELFSPNHAEEDAYSVLNLSLGATQEQIKQAYRKLSLRYHPDTAEGHFREDPQKFIQINKAYHSLLAEEGHKRKVVSKNYHYSWHPEKKRNISSGQRGKVFAWTTGLIVFLLIISFIAALNYRKRTMIAGLQVSRGAFIPPSRVSDLPSAPLPEFLGSIGLQNATNEEALDSIAPNKKTDDEGVSQPRLNKEPGIEVEKKVGIERVKNEESIGKLEPNTSAALIPELSTQKKKQVDGSPKGEPFSNKVDEVVVTKETENKNNFQIKSQDNALDQLGLQISDAHSDEIEERDAPPNSISDTALLEQDLQSNNMITEAKRSLTSVNEFSPLNSNALKNFEASSLARDGVSVVSDNPEKNDSILQIEANANNTDIESRINTFLDNYIKAYDERNPGSFFTFFEADAIENGEPFSSKREIYSELFKSTDKVLLKVNVLSWNNSENKILIKGRFTINLKYKDHRELNGSGPIIFVLSNNKDEPKVKELSYIFEEENK